MKLFMIYDKKGTEYSCISMHPNSAMFIRNVSNEVNSANARSLLSTNAADFDLYCVGDLDVKTGVIIPGHEFICCCADLKEV